MPTCAKNAKMSGGGAQCEYMTTNRTIIPLWHRPVTSAGTQEAEAGKSWFQGQCELHSEIKVSLGHVERLCVCVCGGVGDFNTAANEECTNHCSSGEFADQHIKISSWWPSVSSRDEKVMSGVGSRGRGTCYHAWWPALEPWEPCGGRRELTSPSCSLTFTYAPWHTDPTHVHTWEIRWKHLWALIIIGALIVIESHKK